MDQLDHLPRNPWVGFPKPLLQLIVLFEIIDYGLSAVLYRLGLYPSFATQPASPWDHHNHRGFVPLATPSPPPPVSASAIKKQLRTVAYSRFHNGQEIKSTCSVCLHGLEARDVVRELGNCRHAFHKRCIDAWVDTGKVTCPLCRLQLLPAEDMNRCMTDNTKEELTNMTCMT